MKKISIFIAMCLAATLLLANYSFDVGAYNPVDSGTSAMWSAEYFRAFDDNLDLILNIKYFQKTDNKMDQFDYTPGGGIPVTGQRLPAEITTMHFPMLAGARYNITETGLPIVPFIGGGVGFAFTWQNIFVVAANDPENPDDPLKNYPKFDDIWFWSGWVYNVNAGAAYQIGDKSQLYGKIDYMHSKLTRNTQKTDDGITRDARDMSGMGISIGLRVKF